LDDLREGVERAAARTHGAGVAFFADFFGFSSAADGLDALRAVKAEVQANVAGLKLSRVNVYAIATDENAVTTLGQAGGNLRKVFREDFVAVDLNLIVVLDESKANTYQFLKKLPDHSTTFDRVFLLSAKNEHNEVRAGSFENICETIAALPLVNDTDSRFCEILAARSFEQGKVLFASAGAWLRPDSNVAENRELHRQAEVMEREIAEQFPNIQEKSFSYSAEAAAIPEEFNDNEIVENIASVAAKPLRFWHLWGYTIGDAEKFLFGDGAEKFFAKNYAGEFSREFPCEFSPENMPLSEVAAQERALCKSIDELTKRMHRQENELAQSEAMTCPKNPLLGVDYVKTVIGENYARRSAISRLRGKITQLNAQRAAMQSQLDRAREKIRELKALPVSDENEKYNLDYVTAYAENLAPIAISLLRDDGLLREAHTFTDASGKPCVLRLLGGFAVQDLSRAAAGN